MNMIELISTLVIAVGAYSLYRSLVQRTVVHEYENGLLYKHGKLIRLLGPGTYHLLKTWNEVTVIDMRKRIVTVGAQELLSSDNIPFKASVAVAFRVTDPQKTVTKVQNYTEVLYLAVQLALRSAVRNLSIDQVLTSKLDIAQQLREAVQPQSEECGLALELIDVKDIMLGADVRKIFAETLRAQKEGQAALERARGESASLRNLANAARMLDDNPALLNLRVLQAMSAGSNGAGHTLVLGMPQAFVPYPGKKKSQAPAEPPEE
jgi:regulator of protease activity HflC (stomatin/prohibitin superfamily)